MTMRFYGRLAAMTVTIAAASACCTSHVSGQFDQPQAQNPPGEVKDKVLDKPVADAKAKTVSLPAAFWNQHLTNWVEVGLCGRPSEFLHETIVSIFTTREAMMTAAREAGFHDADYWVASVADFPRIRGDRAMILLEVELNGKKEIFPLDELLGYQNMGVTIGPFGWMYKGDPERAPAEPAATATSKPATIEAASMVLGDDPQIALQFKGIRGLSRSFMDHPLCYDQWIYPVVRYQRNYAVQPKTLDVPKTKTIGEVPAADPKAEPTKVESDDDAATNLGKFWAKLYDSNGGIKVQMTIAKVTEEQFLTAMAQYWHNDDYAKYIKAQLGTAKQIDADKAELEKQILAVRAMFEKGKAREDIFESDEFAKVALLSAKIEKGYAAQDAAWVSWSMEHPVFEAGGDDKFLAALKEQAGLSREHMVDWKDRAALADAEQARFDLRAFKGQEKAKAAEILAIRGKELVGRSRALQLEGRHLLAYWTYENNRLTPDETREDWIRSIKSQLELAQAKQEMAKTGIALGELMQKVPGEKELAAARDLHAKAASRTALADLNAELAIVQFEIKKRESFPDDPELLGLKKREAELLLQIKQMVAATQPK